MHLDGFRLIAPHAAIVIFWTTASIRRHVVLNVAERDIARIEASLKSSTAVSSRVLNFIVLLGIRCRECNVGSAAQSVLGIAEQHNEPCRYWTAALNSV
jgi:hypothetical protein